MLLYPRWRPHLRSSSPFTPPGIYPSQWFREALQPWVALVPWLFFWALPTAVLKDTGAGHWHSADQLLGNLSVFASQFLMGWLTEVTRSSNSSMYVLVAAAVAVAVLTLSIPARLVDN
jgi:hypothetical protein